MLTARTFGEGRPLVMLHGLFGEGENLRGIGRALGGRCTVHLLDLPNHGRSAHTSVMNYRSMSAAVAEYVGSLREPVVMGHSMGGKVAMVLALTQPELPAGVLVLDIAPRTYEPSHHEFMDAMLSLDLPTVTGRADADAKLSHAIPSKPVRSFLLKNLVEESGRYRWKMNLQVLRERYDQILEWPSELVSGRAYSGPTAFVAGLRSDYLIRERDQSLLDSYFPEASLHEIADAGHWIHADAPQEVLAAANELLDRVS